MHPILMDAWSTDRHNELLRQADHWRKTHPRERPGGNTIKRASGRWLAAMEAAVRRPGSTVPGKEICHDGRSLSRA